MVVLRATRKVLGRLPDAEKSPGESDTALGDWYVNRLVVDRRPLLLLVSARSLLPMVVPARDVQKLPSRLPELVAARLRRLDIDRTVIDAEVAAMNPVKVAATASRSVLGTMVDFAFAAPSYLPVRDWDETTLPFVESRLAETPCRAGSRDTLFPVQATRKLLAARW